MTDTLFPTDTSLVTPEDGDLLLVADNSNSNNPAEVSVAWLSTKIRGDIVAGDIPDISASYQVVLSEGAFANWDKTKLDAIEAGADVTDATNVAAAGALMDSEVTNLAQVKAFDSADYATAAQGALADSALQSADIWSSVQAYDNHLDDLAGLVPGVEGNMITSDWLGGYQISTASAVRSYLNVENGADVTDTANVTAAGALMDSEVTNLAQVKAFNSADYATAAQGSTADSALQDVVDDTTPQLWGNLDVNGNKIVSTANWNIDIEPNGTGNVLLGNFVFDADQTVGAGQDNYVLTYDNSAGTIGLEAATWGWGGWDVSKVGTPVDNQVGVWTWDGTIEGTTGLTFASDVLSVGAGTTGDIQLWDYATIQSKLNPDTEQSCTLTSTQSVDAQLGASGYFNIYDSGGTAIFAISEADATPYFTGWQLDIQNTAGTFSGILDMDNITTSSKTFTFPNNSGTVALTSDITGTNSGTNTGDQTSIVGITGTKSQFDTAVTDDNFAYLGTAQTFTEAQVFTTTRNTAGLLTNDQTGTTYTLVLTDAGKIVTLSNASAITLTIPTNASVAFPTGAIINLEQLGAGQVTVGGAGVTINSKDGNKKLSGQYSGAYLRKTATDTWLLVGDLTA